MQSALFSIGQSVGSVYKRVTSSPESLQSKLNESERRAAEMSVEVSKMNRLEQEVRELEALLSYKETITSENYTAKILARSTETEHTLIIDKGSDDGLQIGLAVTVEDGHLIGLISEVNTHTSLVKLVSDPTSKIPVSVLGQENTLGLVEGRGGFLLEMGYIPHGEHIEQYDIVVTSGLEGSIPAGIIVGSIFEVKKVDTNLFTSASIQPFIDPSEYSRVFIIDPLAKTVYGS